MRFDLVRRDGFFLKLLCLIFRGFSSRPQSVRARQNSPRITPSRGRWRDRLNRSLPDPSLPSTAARRPQVMGRACGAYPSFCILLPSTTPTVNKAASTAKHFFPSAVPICTQSPRPITRQRIKIPPCCSPHTAEAVKKNTSDVRLQPLGTGAPPPPSPASTSRPTLNLVGAVFVHVDPCL